MMETVQFNRQLPFVAVKIKNVPIYGMLTPELEAGQATMPQSLPEHPLGRCFMPAHADGQIMDILRA